MKPPIPLDKEQLEKLYVVQKLSMREIASQFNVSPSHVCHYLHKYGIKTRSNGRPRVTIIKGGKYGHLTAISFYGISDKGHQLWECECDCEQHTRCIVKAADILRGHTTSCGSSVHAGHNTKHGMAKSRLNNIYFKMIERCHKQYSPSYKDYGAKGIKVCSEWLNDFTSFANWALSHGYSENLTIDRIDNNKGYTPENCRWATFKQQQNNRTNNRIIEFDGEKHTLSEWSDITGLSSDRIGARLDKLGWDLERALTQDSKIVRKE